MSISLCLTNSSCGSPSSAITTAVSYQTASSAKMDLERTQIATVGENGEKLLNASSSSKAYKKVPMPQQPTSAVVSTMYGPSKSNKKYYNNASNRKKQQQHIINSLKSWNLKIVPSGLDKFEEESGAVALVTANQKKCPNASEDYEHDKNGAAEGVVIPSSKKKMPECKSSKCKPEETKEHQPLGAISPVMKIDRNNAGNQIEQIENKHARSFESTAEGAGGNGNVVHSHTASSHLTDTRAELSNGRADDVSSHSESLTPAPSFTTRASNHKHSHKSYARSSGSNGIATNHFVTPNSGSYSTLTGSSEKSNTGDSRAGTETGGTTTTAGTGQSHVSVMSLMLQGSSKQHSNDAVLLKQFPKNSSTTSALSKVGHTNSHVVNQNHASYIPPLGSQNPVKQQQQQQQQQVLMHNQDLHQSSLQQHSNTVPHQYSYDFLRDVGLKMSLCTVTSGGGNSPAADMAMYHGTTPSQVNYNFTQQFQQHMMQHHHHNSQLHQHNSRQSPHNQQQPLVQMHRILPQQHAAPYNRSQSSSYGGDELQTQQCVMTESQAYNNYALLSAAEGHNAMNVGKGFEVSSSPSYMFNQNGAGVHSQAIHYPHQAGPEQHHVQMHTNYHQNNNYQYHNRNGNGGGGGNQLGYASQGAARAIGTVNSREEQGRNGGGNGKKHWNTHGKGGKNGSNQPNGNKHVNKVQNIGYGYRKNYHHYYNHSASGGNHYYEHITIHQQHQQQQQQLQQQHQQQQQQHHSQHQQNHYKQQHLHRNLVYVRGYDRGHGALSSTEPTNGNHPQGNKQTEPESPASPVHPENESVAEKLEMSAETTKDNEGKRKEVNGKQQEEINASNGYREAEDDPDKTKSSDSHEESAYKSKKRCSVPRSSSCSSVVSIPSTESSVLSCNNTSSQNHHHLLESTHANGHDYESDSSHSSDYLEGTFRYSKYNETNEDKGFRSSSSTSSGISSSSAYPSALAEFVPSAPSSLHASTAGLVGEFIVRSQSFHGSHQNLMAYGSSIGSNGSGGGSSSVGEHSPPIGSLKGTARTVTGTQSVPVFGELFGNATHSHPNPIQFINSCQSAGSFGSSSSLELVLQSAAASSSSSSSLSASSVPPNDVQSMQSGHPKTRSQSGRSSPVTNAVHNRSNRTTATNNAAGSLFSSATEIKGHPSSGGTTLRKNNQVSMSYVQRSSLPADFQYTPADRFIVRADDVEMKTPPNALTDGGAWDNLSLAMWDKFTAAQQSGEKYLQKMQLWRDLYICIKKGFPKYSLYLVGSTISGFGADSSDVDMCLVSRSAPSCYDPRLEALLNLSLVKEYFMSMPSSSFNDFSLIQAKVPILRFQDSKHGIEVDLNFNNCVGIRNTHLLHCYSQMDWRVRPLVLVVKLWARHHNINDAKNMTISSYSLVLMVIHFLQCGTSPPVLPCLHALHPDKFMKINDIHNIEMIERIEPYHTDNKDSLGELLLNFLEYYTKFDYEHCAISVRTSSIMPIEECRLARSYKNDPHHWKHLCIEEPFDFTNTARSVFDGDVFEQIKSTFATSWRMLKESKSLSVLFGEPLFTPVTSTLSITS